MPQSPNARANDLQRKTAGDLAALQGVPQTIAQLLREVRSDTQRIRGTGDLTPAAKSRLVREARETAALRLESLAEDAADVRQAIDAEAEQVLARPDTDDPTRQLLRELQLQRAWTRTERSLKSGATVAEIIMRAADTRDAAAFDALRAEIGGWLLEHKADTNEIETTHALIEEHEDVVLPSDQRAAKAAHKEAEHHAYFSDMALNQAREELRGGPEWSQLPAGPDDVIALGG